MSNELVLKKLTNFLGPSKARTLMGEVLAHLGLLELRDADDRLLFGSTLVARGGASRMVGRSIASQARLHGAQG